MIIRHKLPWILFIFWAALTLTFIHYHAFWLDEVINLILGIGADPHYGIHGNGHPALWFLILRGLFLIFHRVWVLPLASFLVAAAAIWLFLFKGPFSIYFRILFLLSNFALYEYVVMARNYGISMLVMFLLAMIVSNKRIREKWAGPCMVALCNTNLHSAMLGVCYTIGQAIPLCTRKEHRNKTEITSFLKLSSYTALGVILCLLTILPTFDTSAQKSLHQILNPHNFKNTLLVSRSFNQITFLPYTGDVPQSRLDAVMDAYENPLNKHIYSQVIDDDACLKGYLSHQVPSICYLDQDNHPISHHFRRIRQICIIITSLLLVLSTFAFWGDEALFVPALASLFGFGLFFSFMYWGGYRHQALWLVFMTMLLWIRNRKGSLLTGWHRHIRAAGSAAFAAILLLQIYPAYKNIHNELYGTPNSNSKNLAAFIKSQPQYKNSILISNYDFLLEAVHYYSDNPTFVTSEDSFSLFFPFAKGPYTHYSLSQILHSARYLAACNNVPVLILLANPLKQEHRVLPESVTRPTLYHFEYLDFSINPDEMLQLKSQSHKIASFDEATHEPTMHEAGFSIYALSPQEAHIQGSCPARFLLNGRDFNLNNTP